MKAKGGAVRFSWSSFCFLPTYREAILQDLRFWEPAPGGAEKIEDSGREFYLRRGTFRNPWAEETSTLVEGGISLDFYDDVPLRESSGACVILASKKMTFRDERVLAEDFTFQGRDVFICREVIKH